MRRLKSGSGRDFYDGAAARCIANDDYETFPTKTEQPPTRIHMSDIHESDSPPRNTEVAPAPRSTLPPPEAETKPFASERPAIAPPARLPDAEELQNSALAARQPPDWWPGSFIGTALADFSADAKTIREERAERRLYEASQLKLQGQILEAVQRAEQSQETNFKLVHSAIHNLQASDVAQNERLLEGDERFERIEKSITALRAEMLAALPLAVTEALAPYIERIEALERELAHARAAEAP